MTCSESRTFSFQLCRNTVSLMSMCFMTPCLHSCSHSCLLVRVAPNHNAEITMGVCFQPWKILEVLLYDPVQPRTKSKTQPNEWKSFSWRTYWHVSNTQSFQSSETPPVPQTFPLPGTPDHRICRLVSLHALCAGVLVLLQWYCYRHRFWKVRNSAVLQLPTSFDQYDNMNNMHISFMHYAQ